MKYLCPLQALFLLLVDVVQAMFSMVHKSVNLYNSCPLGLLIFIVRNDNLSQSIFKFFFLVGTQIQIVAVLYNFFFRQHRVFQLPVAVFLGVSGFGAFNNVGQITFGNMVCSNSRPKPRPARSNSIARHR
jgi:hypothetical protein